jgi:hypothetical protein
MTYTLNREMQALFFKKLIGKIEIDDNEVIELIEGCEYFVYKVHGSSYFLVKDIQMNLGKMVFPDNYLEDIYSFKDSTNFHMEELSHEFISFMLQNISNRKNDLDTDLYEIQRNFDVRYE